MSNPSDQHQPRRGSDVEAWIKRERDLNAPGCGEHTALDDLLDDYRLRADEGRTLTDMEDHHGKPQ